MRWCIGNGNCHRATIGPADDYVSAGTLAYDEACKRGRDLVSQRPDNQALALGRSGLQIQPIETAQSEHDSAHRRSPARAGAARSKPNMRRTWRTRRDAHKGSAHMPKEGRECNRTNYVPRRVKLAQVWQFG